MTYRDVHIELKKRECVVRDMWKRTISTSVFLNKPKQKPTVRTGGIFYYYYEDKPINIQVCTSCQNYKQYHVIHNSVFSEK